MTDTKNSDYSGDVARLYEAVHRGKGKDYRGEADAIADVVLEHAPGATSLLDVACGTGAHARHLADRFARVEGLELSPDMLELARGASDLTFHAGDMRTMDLPARFDAVTCMFSSIGHMADVDELAQALQAFARHVTDDGVVLIEPWWFPDSFIPGWISADTVEVDGSVVTRVSHSLREGDATAIEVHYLHARPEEGIEHHQERHLITLFTREQYEGAFRSAGLDVVLLEDWPSGRGLFVGTPARG